MSDKTNPSELAAILAAQQDLERALTLFPDAVKAAAERGLRPLGPPPAGTSALITPAPVFNPLRFEPDA